MAEKQVKLSRIGICMVGCIFSVVALTAQSDCTIVFRGIIFDMHDTSAHPVPIVINKRTGTGMSGSANGEFYISGIKSDTFIVASGGYSIHKFCFTDSVYHTAYNLKIGLSMKENLMNVVVVHPIKELDEIQRERENIGVQETRTAVGVTDAFESPITFLYEKYSREGRSKALVAMLENEDKKQEILKELFRTYQRAGVIDLDETEYDRFIAYLAIPEYVLKNYSDYDLALFIRNKYLAWKAAETYHLHNQR